jgi:type IV pilus assembly protein PilA
MKKMNNKGFSLVELIIVIAIMAVLVGVLAPQYLKYVESSRKQKDESAVGEVLNAVKIACSVEDVYKTLASGQTVKVSDNNIDCGSNTALSTEIGYTITASDIEFTSKAYAGKTYTITITIDSTTGVVSVTGAWPAAAGT